MFSRKYGYVDGSWGYDEKHMGSLDFLSVGVVQEDPGDIEFTYWLDCSDIGEDGRPAVYWSHAGTRKDWKRAEPSDLLSDERRAQFKRQTV